MKIHEYNEMMAYLTRPARTVYNSGGRVGFSQGSNLLNKLTDAQIRKLFPTYFDAAATATKVDEDIIRKILKMYSAKEGGRTYIGKQLKLDQSVIGRILNKAFEKNILKPVNPAEFKTNLALKKYGDISERNIYKIVRPVEPRDYIKDPTIPKSARFKVQVPSGEKGTTTKMVYTTTKSAGENAIKKAEKLTETIKIAKKKPFEDAVKAIHRIAMANPEDLNNIKNLSKMVYGADDVKNLTRTANDLVRYQEFLLGFRPIAGISIPVEEKLTDIISEFPSSGQWGKFAAGAIRESKLKMRDQLLKTKGPKLITLRNNILKFVDSGAMQLDEAMGVSATFETAPGYTELGQIIKKSINQAKSKEIDNPFSKLFAKVVAGETNPTITHKGEKIGVKEFNEISKKFQKINKVDTPIIEYKPGQKLNASKFITHFDKLSPEAKINIKELASKGIVLKSEAKPMGLINKTIKTLTNNGASKNAATKVSEALQSMTNKFGSGADPMDVARWAKAELGVIAEVGAKYGGKVFRGLAAIDLPINQVLFAKYVTDFKEDSSLWTTLPMAFTDEVSKFYNLYDKSGGRIKNFIKLAARSGVPAKLAKTVFPLISKAGKFGSTLALPFIKVAQESYNTYRDIEDAKKYGRQFGLSEEEAVEALKKKWRDERPMIDDYMDETEMSEIGKQNLASLKRGAQKLGSFFNLANDPYAYNKPNISGTPIVANTTGDQWLNQGGRVGYRIGGLIKLFENAKKIYPLLKSGAKEELVKLFNILKKNTITVKRGESGTTGASGQGFTEYRGKYWNPPEGGFEGAAADARFYSKLGGPEGKPKVLTAELTPEEIIEGKRLRGLDTGDPEIGDIILPESAENKVKIDYLNTIRARIEKILGMAEGGRVGFDKGTKPKNLGRRTFLKGITALAALPFVGRYFKLGKVLERASTYTGPAIEKIKGMPEWFPGLVKKLWNEGDDVTKTAATGERQIVMRGELEGGDEVDLIYQMDTGDVRIDVTPGKGKYETTSGAYNKEYELYYQKGIADEGTKGKPVDEFSVSEVEVRSDPNAMDIDWEGKITDVDDAMSDLTELEAFAKNKTTTQIHKKKGTKKKDVFPEVEYDDSYDPETGIHYIDD